MELYKILDLAQEIAVPQQENEAAIPWEAINRIIWAGWKVSSLRSIQPWRCLVIAEHNRQFWVDFAEFLNTFFQQDPESKYFTKFYGPQFDHAAFIEKSKLTLLLCIDWNSYVQEFTSLQCFYPETPHTFLAWEAGRVVQNLILAIRNEGYAEYCLPIECQIPKINSYIAEYLQIPSHFRLLTILPIGEPGAIISSSSRPLDTFIYKGAWRPDAHSLQECPRASQCKRFRFIFPKYCSVCSRLIDSHHYHDVPNGHIYCDSCARQHILDDPDRTLPTNASQSAPPRLCEYWFDCEGVALFDPKICSACGGVMGAHWHNTDTEEKYCATCTQRLLSQGHL